MNYHTFGAEYQLGERVQRSDIERPEPRKIVNFRWTVAIHGREPVGLQYGTELVNGGDYATFRENQLTRMTVAVRATT